jgi:hypothetical protein
VSLANVLFKYTNSRRDIEYALHARNKPSRTSEKPVGLLPYQHFTSNKTSRMLAKHNKKLSIFQGIKLIAL